MESTDAKVIVDLLQKQNNLITGLWGIYIGATFTGAAFSFNADDLAKGPMIAVSIGFIAFAIGHLALIRQALLVTQTMGNALLKLRKPNQTVLEEVLIVCSKTANSPKLSMILHVIIDISVVMLICRPLWE